MATIKEKKITHDVPFPEEVKAAALERVLRLSLIRGDGVETGNKESIVVPICRRAPGLRHGFLHDSC